VDAWDGEEDGRRRVGGGVGAVLLFARA